MMNTRTHMVVHDYDVTKYLLNVIDFRYAKLSRVTHGNSILAQWYIWWIRSKGQISTTWIPMLRNEKEGEYRFLFLFVWFYAIQLRVHTKIS